MEIFFFMSIPAFFFALVAWGNEVIFWNGKAEGIGKFVWRWFITTVVIYLAVKTLDSTGFVAPDNEDYNLR